MTLPSGMSGRGGLFVGLKAAVIAQNTYEDVWLNLLLVAHKDIKMMIIFALIATIHSSQTSTSPGCGLIKSRHSAMKLLLVAYELIRTDGF